MPIICNGATNPCEEYLLIAVSLGGKSFTNKFALEKASVKSPSPGSFLSSIGRSMLVFTLWDCMKERTDG